jgi:hypothetical protein
VLLAGVLGVAAACSVSYVAAPSPSPSAAPTPAASAAPPDYNSRLGTNRAGAEAAALLGKQLATGGYWEVAVRTVPAQLGSWPPGSAEQLRLRTTVTAATVVMATESSGAIRSFRAGGHEHEQAVILSLLRPLAAYFPSATDLEVLVFYGESDQHAVGSYQHGSLTYRVLDGL